MRLGQHYTKLTWVYQKGDVSKCLASILFSGKWKLSPNSLGHFRKICPGKFLMKPENTNLNKKLQAEVKIRVDRNYFHMRYSCSCPVFLKEKAKSH